MSAPRIKVIVNSYDVGELSFLWWCTESVDEPPWWCAIDTADTIAAAANAGREHLRQAYPQPITPLVQTIVNSTRCTCGDLPAPSFPWFRPCPAHSYLVNPTKADLDATWAAGGNVYQAADGAKSTYCRPHGCARTECGGCIDPIINAAPQRLARVDMASEYPNAALVALSGAGEARTGYFGPLDQAHNEGARR